MSAAPSPPTRLMTHWPPSPKANRVSATSSACLMPTRRFRLLARAEIDGAIREPGYVFTLADGEMGPHRTLQNLEADAPLFEPLTEGKPR